MAAVSVKRSISDAKVNMGHFITPAKKAKGNELNE